MDSFSTPKGDIRILYEDADVIAFEKPSGILSQKADGSNEDSVLEYLDNYFVGGTKAYPVHRLDRGTGGVMLAAKNAKAAAALSAVITSGGMNKEYLAAVHGDPGKGGTLEDMLYFDRKKNKSFVVKPSKNRRGVKLARLEYVTLASNGSASLVGIRLMTGRTHQIRVQMANIGCPLLGDGKYGGRDNKCPCALWSHRISFDMAQLNSGYFKGKPFAKAAADNPDLLTSEPCGYPWDMFVL